MDERYALKTYTPKGQGEGRRPVRVSGEREILASYGAYLADESRFGEGRAQEIFFPSTEVQVCSILKEMSDKRVPVTISGARTGITSAAVPMGGVVINMERMNRIDDLLYDPKEGWSVWIEPGYRLSDFHSQVEEKSLPLSKEKLSAFIEDHRQYFYPPDPTEETALIGSTVATNASGARSLFYGSTREFVLGMRVALANGEILELERGACPIPPDGRFRIIDSAGREHCLAPPRYVTPLMKSTCGLYSRPGMELIDLFIGSEGILGVITAIRLRLVERPDAILSGLSFFPEEKDALQFVLKAREMLHPLALEYFDCHSLYLASHNSGDQNRLILPQHAKAAIFWETGYREKEMEDVYEKWEGTLVSNGSSMEGTWAGLEKKDWERLKQFRHAIPESINRIIAMRKLKAPEIHKVSTDMAVPDDQLVTIMDEYKEALIPSGLDYLVFGHIGENHLHVNIMPRDEEELAFAKGIVIGLARKVVSLGGVVAAEHGIGKLKHELLRIQYGEEGLKEMARVKRALDPYGILCRGNITPESYLPALM